MGASRGKSAEWGHAALADLIASTALLLMLLLRSWLHKPMCAFGLASRCSPGMPRPAAAAYGFAEDASLDCVQHMRGEMGMDAADCGLTWSRCSRSFKCFIHTLRDVNPPLAQQVRPWQMHVLHG